MKQPLSFINRQHPKYVYHLKKVIYGLKQAPCQWFSTLTNHLLTSIFILNQADPSFLPYNHKGVLIYLIIYIDDILLTSSNTTTTATLLHDLQAHFSIKNHRPISNFLRIQVSSGDQGFLLTQSKYARKILTTNARMLP